MEQLIEALRCMDINTDHVQQYATWLQSGDPLQVLDGAKGFRMILSTLGDIPIQDVINTGIVPILCNLLNHESSKLQFEAAWAITNIASGNSEQTACLVSCGCIPLLCRLLYSQSEEIREQGIWALGNIAGDRAEYRDILLRTHNFVTQIILCFETAHNISTMRTCMWTFSNLTRGSPRPKLHLVYQLIPVLVTFILTCTDITSLSDALWSLEAFGTQSAAIEIIAEQNFIRRILSLFNSTPDYAKRAVVRLAGHISSNCNSKTDLLIRNGLMPALMPLIRTQTTSLKKDVFWVFSNIAAGTLEQQRLLNTYVRDIIEICINEESEEIRKEIAWMVGSLCYTSDSSIITLIISCRGIEVLASFIMNEDTKVATLCLNALEKILDNSIDPSIIQNVFYSIRRCHENAENNGIFEMWQKTGSLLSRIDCKRLTC